jgi:hypothetical protein
MTAPENILSPNGTPVWTCDGTGATVQDSTMTARDLVLGPLEAAPSPPAPGYLKLYSPDGQSIQTLNGASIGAPLAFGAAYATVAKAGQTVTGVTAETLLASGITVPAGGLAAGQVYRFVAVGTITTTVDTQTIDLRLRFGGLAGTLILDFGAQTPNSGAPVTAVAWSAQFDIIATTATNLVVSAQDALNFFTSSVNGSSTAVTNTVAKQFVLTVQPSATAVDMICTGFYCQRTA